VDKLDTLAARHEELLHALADPTVLADPARYKQFAREQAALAETVNTYREYQRVSREAQQAAAMAQAHDAYRSLNFESGVHRVQRVPVTEASGRIHTSTATVAVLPEAEEVDVHVDESDLRIDVSRAGGQGG